MKIKMMIIVGVCLAAAPLAGQDIESQLAGSTNAHGFTIKDGSGSPLFRLRGDGRLGMGTTSPTGMIHLQDFSGGMNGLRMFGNTQAGWPAMLVSQSGEGDAGRFIIDNSSSLGNSLSATTNAAGAAILANSSNANGRIMQLTSGATSRFVVFSDGTTYIDGGLGLGTSTPSSKLDITGSGITNAIRVLPWSGSGSAIWVNQSGSGNAARFQITSNSSTSNSVVAETNAAAPAILATSSNASGRIMQANNLSTARFFVESNGNVGIGVDDATQDLDVLNNARFRGVTSSAYATALNLTSTGVLTTATSDARLKTNIQPLDGALEKVMQLQGVRYNWKSEPDGGARIGFLAQDVHRVVPEVAFTNPVDGYMGVNYAELTAVLVEAVKQQQAHIEEQRAHIEELRARIETLQAKK